MAKSFEQSYAESGKQSELDALAKNPTAYQAAKSSYEKTSGLPVSTLPKATGTAADQSGKLYGGWYDNPAAGGKNQRYWGNNVWTDGNEPSPGSTGELTTMLNDYQINQLNQGDLAASITPTTAAPTPINRTSILEEQRTKYGVADTEKQLSDLKAQEATIQAVLRAQAVDEKGKPVAMNVISGRLTKEQQDAQTKLDYLNVQKAVLVDELSTKYNTINTYVNYAGLDYQDAVKAYDDAFDRNLKIQTFLSNEKQNTQTNARANLTTVMNAITSGNLSYSDISSDEKLQIQKLEIQSGLPVGTMSKLKVSAKDKIMGFSDDKTQAFVVGEDGGFKVINTGLPKTPKKADAATVSNDIVAAFNNVKGADGYVDPKDYKDMRQYWVQQTGSSTADYDKQFAAIYVNPNSPESYGVSPSLINPD